MGKKKYVTATKGPQANTTSLLKPANEAVFKSKKPLQTTQKKIMDNALKTGFFGKSFL